MSVNIGEKMPLLNSFRLHLTALLLRFSFLLFSFQNLFNSYIITIKPSPFARNSIHKSLVLILLFIHFILFITPTLFTRSVTFFLNLGLPSLISGCYVVFVFSFLLLFLVTHGKSCPRQQAGCRCQQWESVLNRHRLLHHLHPHHRAILLTLTE